MSIHKRITATAMAGFMASAVIMPAWAASVGQTINAVAVDGNIVPAGISQEIVVGNVVGTGDGASAVISTDGPCGDIPIGPNQVVEITQALLDGTDCSLVAITDGGNFPWVLGLLGLVPLAFIDTGDGDDDDPRSSSSN